MDLFPLRLLLSRCFITAMEQEIKTSFSQSCNFIKSVRKVFSVKGLELITGTVRILKLHRCSLLLNEILYSLLKGFCRPWGWEQQHKTVVLEGKKLQNSLTAQV